MRRSRSTTRLHAAYARGDNVLASATPSPGVHAAAPRISFAAESDIVRYDELMETRRCTLQRRNPCRDGAQQGTSPPEDWIAGSGVPAHVPERALTFFQLARGRLRLDQHRVAGNPRAAVVRCEHGGAADSNSGSTTGGGSRTRLHAADRRDDALPYPLRPSNQRDWGAAPALGFAAAHARASSRRHLGQKLLRESFSLLEGSQTRLEYAKSLVDLGAALRRGNQRPEAREYIFRPGG